MAQGSFHGQCCVASLDLTRLESFLQQELKLETKSGSAKSGTLRAKVKAATTSAASTASTDELEQDRRSNYSLDDGPKKANDILQAANPDGRLCLLCGAADDSADPVYFGYYLVWGYPPP